MDPKKIESIIWEGRARIHGVIHLMKSKTGYGKKDSTNSRLTI